MHCFTASRADSIASGGKQSVKRLLALTVCVLFIAVSILSGAVILIHANHIHDYDGPHGSCAACAHLATAGNLLKSLAAVIAGAALAFPGLFAILSVLKPVDPDMGFCTLVRLKIRLNN
jgi:hypothetical protein